MWDWKNSPPSLPGDPKRFLKIVLSVSFGLLVLWVFVMAQTDSSERQAVSVEEQQRLDSLRQALGTDSQDLSRQTESQGMFFNALTTFLVLGGLAIAFWWWYSRKYTTQNSLAAGSPVAKVVGNQQIGMGQEIKVIEINEEYWVLGVSSQSVNLLHRYQKDEWKSPEQLKQATRAGQQDSSFSRILSSLQQRK